MLNTIKRLFFRIPWTLRWIVLLSLPWIAFFAFLLYSYYQIDPDDREADIVEYVYCVLRLPISGLLLVALILCGSLPSWIYRKVKWSVRWVVILGVITVVIFAFTLWDMYSSYEVLNARIQ